MPWKDTNVREKHQQIPEKTLKERRANKRQVVVRMNHPDQWYTLWKLVLLLEPLKCLKLLMKFIEIIYVVEVVAVAEVMEVVALLEVVDVIEIV